MLERKMRESIKDGGGEQDRDQKSRISFLVRVSMERETGV